MEIRGANELIDIADPAWPEIAAIAAAHPDVHVLEVEPSRAESVLWSLQVTVRSYLGAMAFNCGGLLVDHGWFRLLGGGSTHMDDLASANGLGEPSSTSVGPGFMVVGHDALGGRFAIDGGGLGISPGEVCYFGPDSLTWQGLGGGHADFVSAAMQGQLAQPFASLRWPGWEREVEVLPADRGLSLFPPPFTREGQDIGSTSRRAVPIHELFGFYDEAAQQITGA